MVSGSDKENTVYVFDARSATLVAHIQGKTYDFYVLFMQLLFFLISYKKLRKLINSVQIPLLEKGKRNLSVRH